MDIDPVARVTKVSTNQSRGCEHCSYSISYEDLPGAINRYISAHGYKLLHVGSETITSHDGTPRHTTIAMLGSENPPPLRDMSAVVISLSEVGEDL